MPSWPHGQLDAEVYNSIIPTVQQKGINRSSGFTHTLGILIPSLYGFQKRGVKMSETMEKFFWGGEGETVSQWI